MTPNQVIELAKQAGFPHQGPQLAAAIQRFAEMWRNEVLEEAAKVCDGWLHADGDACADAIRGLKS